jgi:hypothetical protein
MPNSLFMVLKAASICASCTYRHNTAGSLPTRLERSLQLRRGSLRLVHPKLKAAAGHGFALARELDCEETKSAARFFPRRADA